MVGAQRLGSESTQTNLATCEMVPTATGLSPGIRTGALSLSAARILAVAGAPKGAYLNSPAGVGAARIFPDYRLDLRSGYAPCVRSGCGKTQRKPVQTIAAGLCARMSVNFGRANSREICPV
jgi:hypothetical protein